MIFRILYEQINKLVDGVKFLLISQKYTLSDEMESNFIKLIEKHQLITDWYLPAEQLISSSQEIFQQTIEKIKKLQNGAPLGYDMFFIASYYECLKFMDEWIVSTYSFVDKMKGNKVLRNKSN
jgi:hypothetical protein